MLRGRWSTQMIKTKLKRLVHKEKLFITSVGSIKFESVQWEIGKVASIITIKWMSWISRVLPRFLFDTWKQVVASFPFLILGKCKTKISLPQISAMSLVTFPFNSLFINVITYCFLPDMLFMPNYLSQTVFFWPPNPLNSYCFPSSSLTFIKGLCPLVSIW